MKTFSQQIIKGNNLKAIYNLIFKYDGISRVQLAQNRKLSKTAISTLVEELISRKFIYDFGAEDSGNIGRKPNRFINFADGIGAAFFIGNHMIGRAGGSYTQVGQLLASAEEGKEKFLVINGVYRTNL